MAFLVNGSLEHTRPLIISLSVRIVYAGISASASSPEDPTHYHNQTYCRSMLRRHSTKSKSDLHRRKSTTSVRSVPLEHINVAVAQRDARLAAVEAFARGQDRLSAEMAMFPPQSTSVRKENSSPARISRNNSTASQYHSGQDDHVLGRRQSVRFVGPDSGLNSRASRISMRTTAPDCPDIPQRRSIYRSQSSQDVAHRPRSVLRDTQNLQLPDRISSVGKTAGVPEPGLSQAYLQALAPDYEQYTPEDDVASMPSSYRRVRKTRSMYTPRNSIRNGVDEGNKVAQEPPATDKAQKINPATSVSRYSFLYRKQSDSRPTTSALTAPKSMSFLRQRRDRGDSSVSAQDSACGSSPAMDSHESSHRSRRLLPKPSRLFGSRGKGIGTDSPKESRSSSPTGVIPTSATGVSLALSLSRHGSMKSKARKVSSSLKSRFKSLFVNKSEDDAKLPAQQIEAQKTHVSEIYEDNPWTSSTGGFGHERERSSLSRVSTRLPSLHAVPSSERLRSRRGSIGSFGGESRKVSDEKSRVTSWASTEVNTVIAHNTQDSIEEWDKQRLSIINEHGFHAPSSSLGCQKLGLQTITSQEELASSTALDRLPPGATVDSQRVYSALMKRMNETRQLAGIVEQQRKSSENSDPFYMLSPSSTADSGESSDAAAPGHGYLPRELSCEPSKKDDEYQHHSRSTSSTTRSSYKIEPSPVAGDHRVLSPPIHLTPKGKDAPAARSITDRSSAFFGTPTSHLFRTTSPYRRSLQEAIRAEYERQEPSVDTTETIATTPTQEAAGKVAYSDSNYSEGTQIHNLEMKKEFPVAGHASSTNAHGDVSVLTDTPTYRPTGQRHISTASSVDWKASLAADVEKMEQSPNSPTKVTGRASEVEYALPTMPRSFGCGHVREAAQIGSYDEDEYNSNPTVRMPTNPTTPLGTIDSNVVKLSPQQRSVLRTTPPSAAILQENEAPTSYEVKTLTSLGEQNAASCNLPKDAMRPRASPLDGNDDAPCHRDRRPATQQQPETPTQGPAIRQTKSLARLQSSFSSGIREPQTGSPRPPASSTVRLMRKGCGAGGRLESSGASAASGSSPAFSGAFERHFGSLSGRPGVGGGGEVLEKENRSPHHGGGAGVEVQDQGGLETKGLVRGSKTMVEMFLGSRRRQGASGDGAAFL
ncbi:hypothetical protein VMCG_08515 [Cytospora schulzeri]|uniref:Uncharacterized protein n=1 Tax=Cytospora schulzeri TaxID=448051 RepID=A0A423VWD6_9PEZI|nr:hypothetical protein VMCG_08515 [Valsa malicola]